MYEVMCMLTNRVKYITKRRIFQLILSFLDYKQTLSRHSTNRVYCFIFFSNHDKILATLHYIYVLS